jgi:hypothetical protein
VSRKGQGDRIIGVPTVHGLSENESRHRNVGLGTASSSEPCRVVLTKEADLRVNPEERPFYDGAIGFAAKSASSGVLLCAVHSGDASLLSGRQGCSPFGGYFMKSIHLLVVSLLMALSVQVGVCQRWDKKTKVRFNVPVQVPNASLPAGTYIFKLASSEANRHIVQVFNESEDRVYATILAIPDYRLSATSRTVMYFTERASGAPPAIKSWFYPGDNFGNRFVYPKVEATRLAAEVNQPVPAAEYRPIPTTTAAAPAPQPAAVAATTVVVATPQKTEEQYVAQSFEQHDAQDTAGVDGEPVRETEMAAALPQTASPIHLSILFGLALLGVAAVSRFGYRRVG